MGDQPVDQGDSDGNGGDEGEEHGREPLPTRTYPHSIADKRERDDQGQQANTASR